MYMTERKIMKTISEMNQDEKTELLKTIEENRLDKIKTLKENLEDLTHKPKEFEDADYLASSLITKWRSLFLNIFPLVFLF